MGLLPDVKWCQNWISCAFSIPIEVKLKNVLINPLLLEHAFLCHTTLPSQMFWLLPHMFM